VASRLQSIWYRKTPPPMALRPLSWLFGLTVRLRRAAYERGWYRSVRLPRPVIVVGNLTVGGTGKTPLVIWLCARLRAEGLSPGIVLRGYGGSAARGSAPLSVERDSDPYVVGDEALLLRRRTGEPVAVCRQRVRAAGLLLDAGVNVILSDDGLQHLAMARNFEIAVVDAERGLGNGYLLPAGPLREPRQRLDQLDAVVLNGAGVIDEGQLWRGAFRMNLTGDQLMSLVGGSQRALASFAGQRVHAVAGIGNPERFFSTLRAAGLIVVEHPFPDHHRYLEAQIRFADGLPVLMTEKDAVKCSKLGGPDHWFLPVTAQLADADAAALMARLRRALGV
jgi:tetraacyldisaccharide 4'-kinase